MNQSTCVFAVLSLVAGLLFGCFGFPAIEGLNEINAALSGVAGGGS